jgi:radical SAM-linked protein
MDPSRGRLADVDRRSDAAPDARQRWRITYARDAVEAELVGRAAIDAWHHAVAASGLPIALQSGDGGRPRIAFAAPLPAAARGDRELLDLWLLERIPVWQVRTGLQPCLPEAHRWVDAEDVWLGAPALAGQVTAADWQIELDGIGEGDRARLAAAVTGLVAASTIPRVRVKGTAEKEYDLRPLLLDLRLDAAADGRSVIGVRTRFDPALGAGRPEEVVGALADAAGLGLTTGSMTRTRLILADELARPSPPDPARATGRQPRSAAAARAGRN